MGEQVRQDARWMRPLFVREHHMAPCWKQPGKQQWHLGCAILHPLRFARSRGPIRWRQS